MWTFFFRRLLSLPPLLLVISFLTYLLLQASGGDFFNRLEEDPKVSQDYVMALRASAGRVVPVKPQARASELGTFVEQERNYSFDDDGNLLREGQPISPKTEQDAVKRFTTANGDTYTITEQGKVYLWVGRIRGYTAWLSNAVTGDLGESFQYKTSVAEVISSRVLNTLLLSSIALLIAWGTAIPLGVWSGVRPNSWIDYICGATAYFGLSIPSVFLALLAVLFAYYTGWFPIGGMRDLVGWSAMSTGEKVLDLGHHLVLPASVLGFHSLGGYMRQMRGQMVETMSADYVRTARAKGLSRKSVVYKHALRNAINPLLTLLGFSLAGLLSGSFLVEVVLNWPGLARVVLDAVFARDEPLVMAAVLVATLMLIAGNIIADLLLAWADPKDPPRVSNALPHERGKSPGPWKVLWRRLLHNRVAVAGGIILLLLYGSACFAGFLSPYRYDEGDRNASRAAPMLFGGYVAVEREVPSEVRPGKITTLLERRWTSFEGGIHFHDQDGEFTFRPHVHPLTEVEYRDEYGERAYTRAEDRTISLPVRFFVTADEPSERASLLGLWPIEGRLRLFGVEAPEEMKDSAHVFLLGSDAQGRDIFSRLLFGGQISMSVGLLGVAISMSLGMLVGGISGYFGGRIDFVVMRLIEVILAVPGLYLIIVIGGQLRGMKHADGSPLSSKEIYFAIVAILAFVYWASIARVIRGMVLSLKENEYIVAARAVGVPTMQVIVKHLLPNTLSFAIVTATLSIPYYILGEVALSFLGLGIQDPETSWGILLRDAQETAYLIEQPWVVAPGFFIFAAVMAFNFLGDGLRDAADPKAVIHTAKSDDDE